MIMMFDTHVLIWDFLTPDRLSLPARKAVAMARDAGEVLIADISLWEIGMIIQKGRVQVQTDIGTFIQAIVDINQARIVPITPQIAALSVQLPRVVNQDPADRLIIAAATVENVPLVTADRNLHDANIITTIW